MARQTSRLMLVAIAGALAVGAGCKKTYKIRFMSELSQPVEMEVGYPGMHLNVGGMRAHGSASWAIKLDDDDLPLNVNWVARDPADPTKEISNGSFAITSDTDTSLHVPVATSGYTGPIGKKDEVNKESTKKPAPQETTTIEITE